ncbi:NADH-quinone oxidoreductase subunit NuoN [Desertibaculum subflavum]|uniref:NADH-quinone oxidoreductase subunit NuoN n=1 Tax=Desertibaculum subflavum TaxID=2268458 RepID=UPI000E66DA34
MIADIALALPEIFLAVAAMVLLVFGVYAGEKSTRFVATAAIVALAAAIVLVLGRQAATGFGGMFVVDAFGSFAKILILVGTGLAIAMSLGYLRDQGIERFEFPVLLMLSTIGMMIMVSAGDLIALYLGLELQSLAIYVCAAFKRDSTRSTEAGLKYFVLGALSSGMLLYGASLVYGFAGTTSFAGLAQVLQGGGTPIGVLVGLVFIAAGIAFKCSAAPFHMWTPDVYEGAPTPVTSFMAAAPKVAAIALFMRVFLVPFGGMVEEWRQIIVVIAVLSMVLGAFAAIGQSNIKRLMAYSSIGHVGYALIGLAAANQEGVRGVLIYLAIYLAMNVGTFGVILCMRRATGYSEEISDLAGLARTRPGLAAAMAVFMFSLAGVPPLAGFFGKFYVFMAAVNAGLYVLAVIGVVTSVVGAYYYLRIVKLMYFDAPAEPFAANTDRGVGVVTVAAGLFTLFFFVYPAPIVAGAQIAARALLP